MQTEKTNVKLLDLKSKLNLGSVAIVLPYHHSQAAEISSVEQSYVDELRLYNLKSGHVMVANGIFLKICRVPSWTCKTKY
jgi:hypothetical protein